MTVVGINIIASRFLLLARQLGASFARTATLGRQQMNLDTDGLLENLRAHALGTREEAESLVKAGFADAFLRYLGAETLTVFDASSYEGADVVHDFNLPLGGRYAGCFDAVLDGGTLEHIFNFPQAVANCMTMVRDGGHFLGIMPANNVAGHGFYQFSPELLFRVFSESNGFRVERMILAEQDDDPPYGCASWETAGDPAQAERRLEWRNKRQTCLLVMARKLHTTDLFTQPVQQSDYVRAWRKA